MLDWWNNLSLALFDGLLGWLLDVPRQVALFGVAILTATLLTTVRWWTTDQDRLRRAAEDLRRLKQLRREARQGGDHDTLARCQATKARIGLIKLRAEGKPLLVVLLPIALLATWAFYRLEFHPPQPGETVELIAYLPVSAKDDLLHLVPQPGLRSGNGWVQALFLQAPAPSWWERWRARLTSQEIKLPAPDAVAVWKLEGDADTHPLLLRYKDRTIECELPVGGRFYAPAWGLHPDDNIITEIRQREVRLFGLPGLGAWLPAWLVGYLVVTIPLVFLLKRVLKVY
jgi:uncharacterized membrane protein (DUF106 family)